MPLLGTLIAATVRADDLLYRYEGDVLPYDPGAGWLGGGCEPPCNESIDDGRFVLTWDPTGGDDVRYFHLIARAESIPPDTLWVEWRFRSDRKIPRTFYTCDGVFVVSYRSIHDLAFLFADAVVSFSGDEWRFGLEPDKFHTYRFESMDGANYWFSVDGDIYQYTFDPSSPSASFLQMGGHGACGPGPEKNEWDFVRYGTIGSGEKIMLIDPPGGFIDLRHQSLPDRFAITFDQPNYVYTENITVEVTGLGTKPVVTKTWRRNQDGPETLEVILDRPIPANATTRFIMNDGEIINSIRYTTKLGDVDGDGDTDLIEIAALQNCFYNPVPDPYCGALNFIDDPYIDHADTTALISPYTLTGPQ